MLFTREGLESREHQTLAPYARFADRSRGRIHAEGESAHRTAYQKDRDRVIHTSAFRRLEYKTQVFANHEGDYYRTRLTHTLEVAQVGKAIARALGLNEDLTETIALAHDLGHSPYGHAGERTLNRLTQEMGGFDHNQQSLRVVTELEERYPQFPGLNLTWETLEGIMKHDVVYDLPDTDLQPQRQPSLEAQVVNLADELAYNAHDLDDGLRSGHLNPKQISEVSLVGEVMDRLDLEPSTFGAAERYTLIRELLGYVIDNAVQHSHSCIEETNIKTAHDIQKAQHNIINTSPDLREQLKELKTFLYEHFYFHYRLIRMTKKADHVLTRIFEAYMASPDMLPTSIQLAADKRGLMRAVTDYLASMTDRFVSDEYRRLFDPHALT